MAVPEERVAGLLLDDLAMGMPTDSAPASLVGVKQDEP
jgi:hypothetical protein